MKRLYFAIAEKSKKEREIRHNLEFLKLRQYCDELYQETLEAARNVGIKIKPPPLLHLYV